MTPTPHPHPERASSLTLTALPTAVSCARHFTRHTLAHWRLHALTEAAELIASELVSNAVAATGIAVEQPGYAELYHQHLTTVTVRLRATGHRLLIEVWDASPTPPVLRDPTLDDERGRGLLLVATVSSAWGHDPTRTGGKVVWAELGLPLADASNAVPEPPPPRYAAPSPYTTPRC